MMKREVCRCRGDGQRCQPSCFRRQDYLDVLAGKEVQV